MAWTIPDKAEGDHLHQSVCFQEDLEILVAGISGVDCVLSGLAVTGGADMTPAVAKGAVLTNRVMKAVAAADVTITAADGTNPRIDLIVVNSSGTLAVRAGTAAANPKPPARTANDVVIASVYIPAGDTAIGTSQITDRRVTPSFPLCVYRTTTAETTNTTAAVIEILDKTNSGVVIPNGLFLAGRTLRVRIWGNLLVNATTPTITLAVLYGGTTMFSDVSAATTVDADRRPFVLELNLVAQGNSDQALTGSWICTDLFGVVTAPGTGIGEIWQAAGGSEPTPALGGSAAVDSDAANRTLNVRLTYSVSSASNEVVVEGATVELF